MITLTAKAIRKIKEIAAADDIKTLILRAKVVGGGCAGFSYDLYFEEKIADMDEVFENDGITIVADMLSHQYLEGVEIDYVEGIIGAGFKFLNPNVKGTCGCGSSFSV